MGTPLTGTFCSALTSTKSSNMKENKVFFFIYYSFQAASPSHPQLQYVTWTFRCRRMLWPSSFQWTIFSRIRNPAECLIKSFRPSVGPHKQLDNQWTCFHKMLLENTTKPCRDISVLISNFVRTVLTVTWHKQVFYAHLEGEKTVKRNKTCFFMQWVYTLSGNLKECHPRCVYQNYSRSVIKE